MWDAACNPTFCQSRMNIQIAILGGFRPCVLAWDMKSWLFPVATWLKSFRGFQFSYYVGNISLAYDVHLFGLMRELWIILILCYIYKNIVIPLHTIQNIFTTDTFSGLFFTLACTHHKKIFVLYPLTYRTKYFQVQVRFTTKKKIRKCNNE
jgi:hypothetical protein